LIRRVCQFPEKKVLEIFIKKINQVFEKSLPNTQKISDIPDLFTKKICLTVCTEAVV